MPDEPLTIIYKVKGTLVVEGAIRVLDEAGNEIAQPVPKHPGIVKLCGCGHSETKPFCDGSHKKHPPIA